MNGYAKLGADAGQLLNAFMGRGSTRRGAYEDELGRLADVDYTRQRARLAGLQADELARARDVTADDLLAAFGVDPRTAERVRSGNLTHGQPILDEWAFDPQDAARLNQNVNAPIDPQAVDLTRRGDTVHTLHQMGGGNVQQLMQALLGSQRMNAQDFAMGGAYDPEQLGRSVAAAEGKALYGSAGDDVLDVFRGKRTPGPSSALMDDTPGGRFERFMGKGSWSKLDKESQALVAQMVTEGVDLPAILSELQKSYETLTLPQIFNMLKSDPTFQMTLIQRANMDPEKTAQEIASMLFTGKRALEIESERDRKRKGSEDNEDPLGLF